MCYEQRRINSAELQFGDIHKTSYKIRRWKTFLYCSYHELRYKTVFITINLETFLFFGYKFPNCSFIILGKKCRQQCANCSVQAGEVAYFALH